MSSFFEDEAIFSQAGTVTRTWAPRGKGTAVMSEPVRCNLPVFGAVSIEATPRWHNLFAERLNGVSFLKFLRQVLRRNIGRKVFMVLDNVGYHHSRDVKAWLDLRKDQIELFFLPAYSPEFNPVEAVWKRTKRTSTHNRHFKRQPELRRCLERRFNRYQGNPSSLRGIVARFMPPQCQSTRT